MLTLILLSTVSFAVAALVSLFNRNKELETDILAVLLLHGEMYSLQILDSISRVFRYKPKIGSLYSSLKQLERQGTIVSRYSEEALGQGKYYKIAYGVKAKFSSE